MAEPLKLFCVFLCVSSVLLFDLVSDCFSICFLGYREFQWILGDQDWILSGFGPTEFITLKIVHESLKLEYNISNGVIMNKDEELAHLSQ